MKNGLTTNTLEAEGYGERKFASPRPEGFVKERNKAQTEGITCQVARLATIFVLAAREIGESFMGKGLPINWDAEHRAQVDVLDDDQMLFSANFDALFYALGIKSGSWA